MNHLRMANAIVEPDYGQQVTRSLLVTLVIENHRLTPETNEESAPDSSLVSGSKWRKIIVRRLPLSHT